MLREDAIKIVGVEAVEACEKAEKKYIGDTSYISIALTTGYVICAKYMLSEEQFINPETVKWIAYAYEVQKRRCGRIKYTKRRMTTTFTLDTKLIECIRRNALKEGVSASRWVERAIEEWAKKEH
jgi:hypothetical protein